MDTIQLEKFFRFMRRWALVAIMPEKRDKTGFGDRLRAIRTGRKLTQEELGEKVGMKGQNIARLESGGRTPGWDTVLKLAEALGITPDAFVGEDGETDTPKGRGKNK